MEPFYISYNNRITSTENYPYDIEMGNLENEIIAEAFILEHIEAIIKSDNSSYHFYYPHLLITNDKTLNQKYKYVLNYDEFKLFCNQYENYNSLTTLDQSLIDNGISGDYGKETFIYFEKLIKKEGNRAYQYFKKERIDDEQNGGFYEVEVENGWRIEQTNYNNTKIKNDLNHVYWNP